MKASFQGGPVAEEGTEASALQRQHEDWERTVVAPSIAAQPETRSEFLTGSNDVRVKRLYTPQDVGGIDYLRDIGFPAQEPFTRGVHPDGYRNRNWGLGYYSGHGAAADTNRRYKELIALGATNLKVAMDLPTQVGYDSDHELSRGEVGKVGVAVSSLSDMETVFDGIDVSRISTGTVGNSIGLYTASLFTAVGERQGVDVGAMQVQLQNDPLKEFTGRGTQIFPVGIAVELSTDVVEYACQSLPSWEPQYCCSTQMRWGGASAAQEIGFGIANLVAYIESGLRRGLEIADFAPRMNLHMTTDNDLFEEVAKFRAARRMWARLARERYKIGDPKLLALRISTFTNGVRMTAQQPLNNVVRGTVHALASILGGVEGITVPAFDEALALPTVESTRLADLTKVILHNEHGVAGTIDPLGGSYYVEALTDELESQARAYFDRVEAMGGAIGAIGNGYYQQEMAEGTLRYQREIEDGTRKIVGVNLYELDDEVPIDLFVGNPDAEERQVERLRRLRAGRSAVAVERTLGALRRAADARARGTRNNLVPLVLDAVKSDVTVGEIFHYLREAFGEYRQTSVI